MTPQPSLVPSFSPSPTHQSSLSLPPSSGQQPSYLPHPSPSPSLHFVAVPFHAFHQMTLSAMMSASSATSVSAAAHIGSMSHVSSSNATPGTHFMDHNGGTMANYYSTPSSASPILTGSADPKALFPQQAPYLDKETGQQVPPAGMSTSAAAADVVTCMEVRRDLPTGGKRETVAHGRLGGAEAGSFQEPMAAAGMNPQSRGTTRDFFGHSSHLGPRRGSTEREGGVMEELAEGEREGGGEGSKVREPNGLAAVHGSGGHGRPSKRGGRMAEGEEGDVGHRTDVHCVQAREDAHPLNRVLLYSSPLAASQPADDSGARGKGEVAGARGSPRAQEHAAQEAGQEGSPLKVIGCGSAGDQQLQHHHQHQVLMRSDTLHAGTALRAGGALQTATSVQQEAVVVTSNQRRAQGSRSTGAESEESSVLVAMAHGSGKQGEGEEGVRGHSAVAGRGLEFGASGCSASTPVTALDVGQGGGMRGLSSSTGKDQGQAKSRGVIPCLEVGGGREAGGEADGRREGEESVKAEQRQCKDGSHHHACGCHHGGEGGARGRHGVEDMGLDGRGRGKGLPGHALPLMSLLPGDLSLRMAERSGVREAEEGTENQGRGAWGRASERHTSQGAEWKRGNSVKQGAQGRCSEHGSKRKAGGDTSEGERGRREGEGEGNFNEAAECRKRACPAPPDASPDARRQNPPDLSPQVDSWHTTTDLCAAQDDYHTPCMDRCTLLRPHSDAQIDTACTAVMHHNSSREEGSSSVPSWTAREAAASGNRAVKGSPVGAGDEEERARSGDHRDHDGGMLSKPGNGGSGLGFRGQGGIAAGSQEQTQGHETRAGGECAAAAGRGAAAAPPAGIAGMQGAKADKAESLARAGGTGSSGGTRRVKVFQEGCSVGRAVDLSKVGGYQLLMRLVASKFGVRVDAPDTAEFLEGREMGGSEKRHGGGEKRWYLTYEDMDGDLLAVGDDEWR